MSAKKLAAIVSFVFNPFILSYLVPFLIVYRYTGSGMYALKWFLFSSVFIFGGLSYLVYGRLRGYFSDFDLSKREERPKFYRLLFFLALLYLVLSLFFKGITFPISIFAFGIALAVIAYSITNNYIKASGHVGVACAFVTVIGFLYGMQFVLATLWLVPLLAWSRVVLKRHTTGEIIVGGFLGIIITMLTFFTGMYIYYKV